MVKNHPKRKIGLVTFTDNVAIVGDGSTNPSIISGKELNDYNFILKNGIACA